MAEMTLPARIDNLDSVLAFVDAQLEKLDCPMKVQLQIDVAVEEIYVNIAHYAYAPGEGDAEIRVETDAEKQVFEIEFRDRGVPFDPLAKADPDVTLSAEQRKIGGLGIYMVKKSMDEITYKYREGQNILILRKKIS